MPDGLSCHECRLPDRVAALLAGRHRGGNQLTHQSDIRPAHPSGCASTALAVRRQLYRTSPAAPVLGPDRRSQAGCWACSGGGAHILWCGEAITRQADEAPTARKPLQRPRRRGAGRDLRGGRLGHTRQVRPRQRHWRRGRDRHPHRLRNAPGAHTAPVREADQAIARRSRTIAEFRLRQRSEPWLPGQLLRSWRRTRPAGASLRATGCPASAC
jgi:hypothetical protein